MQIVFNMYCIICYYIWCVCCKLHVATFVVFYHEDVTYEENFFITTKKTAMVIQQKWNITYPAYERVCHIILNLVINYIVTPLGLRQCTWTTFFMSLHNTSADSARELFKPSEPSEDLVSLLVRISFIISRYWISVFLCVTQVEQGLGLFGWGHQQALDASHQRGFFDSSYWKIFFNKILVNPVIDLLFLAHNF